MVVMIELVLELDIMVGNKFFLFNDLIMLVWKKFKFVLFESIR